MCLLLGMDVVCCQVWMLSVARCRCFLLLARCVCCLLLGVDVVCC